MKFVLLTNFKLLTIASHFLLNITEHETVSANHYENSPIQIYRKFHLQKLKIFRWKTRRGGSNGYSQSMFWAEIRKIMYTPVNPVKVGFKGVKIIKACLCNEIWDCKLLWAFSYLIAEKNSCSAKLSIKTFYNPGAWFCDRLTPWNIYKNYRQPAGCFPFVVFMMVHHS